jgi:hypothetical protein
MRKRNALAGGAAVALLAATGAGTAVAWIAVAGAVGFAVSAVFSSVLRLPRGVFVLVYAVAVSLLAALFFRRPGALVVPGARRRLPVASATGLLLGTVLAVGVIAGPGAERPAGVHLATALGWYGIVYGVADAVLLTIIPVLAVGISWAPMHTAGERLRQGAAAITGSLLVTALYHAGFAEFQSPALVQPLIGNVVVTAGYLVTGNPATPLLAHVLMHGAAVLHGMEATVQLPPHY